MPQVAQQDYLRIAPKAGRVLIQDAAALGQIKAAISKGTLWDCICANIQMDNNSFGKILGVYEPASVDVWDAAHGKAFTLNVEFTVEQYEGLSAIQLAEDEKKGVTVEMMPGITVDENNYLLVDSPQMLICVDNMLIRAVLDEDNVKIIDMALTDESATGDWVNITWEDAQKLIGLPIV